MPYVVTDHNTQDFVILGPIEWKPRYIANIVSDEVGGEDVTLTAEDEARVPFDILPGIRVRKCEVVEVRQPNFNNTIHTVSGPTWTYNEDGTATATWNQVDKNIDLVKGELKNVVSANRYVKEVSGFKHTVQGTEVHIDTSRENRNNFHNRLLLTADEEAVNWKFASHVAVLSKAELQTIVNAVKDHVQAAFDWETAKFAEIDSCVSLDQLKDVWVRSDMTKEEFEAERNRRLGL